jgi:hypothetical protein
MFNKTYTHNQTNYFLKNKIPFNFNQIGINNLNNLNGIMNNLV